MRRSAGERRRAGEQRRARRAPPIEIHSAGEKTTGGVTRGAAAARAASGERRGTGRATAPRLGQALRRASRDACARVEVPATQKHGGQRGQVMCASAHAARVPEVECDGARAYQLGRPQDPSVRALAPLDLGALHLPVCCPFIFSRILLFGRRYRMRPRAQLGIAAAPSLATG